jgi:geranylgeranyl reductase family protein
MTKTFDALVCGGSLAGSAAALVLARQGRSVAVLDRAVFPRPKLCGGLLTWKTVRLLETLFGETPASLAEAGAVNHASDRYVIRTPNQLLAEGALSFPFHFSDRAVLDALLLGHARRAGAEVFEGAEVATCDPRNGEATLKTGETFRGRFLIGADGANPVVRKSFPNYDRDRWRELTAPTIEIQLDADRLPRVVEHPELYIGQLEAGYGWVFPNPGKAVLGICGLRRGNVNFSRLFREYLEILEIDPNTVSERRGHPLPYGNYLEEPVCGATLLAGDAGGFVEPLFGEGIFFALCTGRYAGEAVAAALAGGTDPGPRYVDRLHRYVLPELRGSDRLRWTLFRSMGLFGPRPLSWFVKLLGGPLGDMVHGKRSYARLRKKTWDFPTPARPA